MDLSCTKITLHPQAQAFLFEHFRTVNRILHDVIGLLGVDYMGITLLTPTDELLFFSSRKALEFNLIDKNIWQFDASYHPDFIKQDRARLWEELYHEDWREMLHYHKQKTFGYTMGISVPTEFDEYRVVYSYAWKSTDAAIKIQILNRIEQLTCMGRYCLQKIKKAIPLPDQKKTYVTKRPSLSVVANNQGAL